MQLKMSRDKKQWLEYLGTENDYMTFLLEAFQVPETVENDSDDDNYLLDIPHKKNRLLLKRKIAESPDELQEQSEIVRKKLEQRKATKKKSNTLTKDDRKRLKLEKLEKAQKMQNLKKVMKDYTVKDQKIKPDEKNDLKVKDPEKEQNSKVFNKEGKLFFSKVEIEGDSNRNKSKKKGLNTNPIANLQKLKSEKRKIRELIDSGEKLKAKDEKQKVLWKAAFDKTEGVKVKDNEEILKKTIKKRKILKKKSKEKWNERKKKVEEKQAAQQKKREDNINKKKTDKQKTKLKRAIKMGRKF